MYKRSGHLTLKDCSNPVLKIIFVANVYGVTAGQRSAIDWMTRV
jgi:hypothetical protein